MTRTPRSSTPAARSRKRAARPPDPAAAPNDGADLLGPILDALPDPEARDFARLFYARLTPEEYALRSPAQWAEVALDYLRFARTRTPGEPQVRIFNPEVGRHGWSSVHSVLQIVNDDMPFLVDSIGIALANHGVGVHVLGHPVLPVKRDAAGKLRALGGDQHESMMHIEIDRLSTAAMPALQETVLQVLDDVRAAVGDWKQIRSRMLEVAARIGEHAPQGSAPGQLDEARAFLEWASDDHFTYLGYRKYQVVTREGRSLLTAAPKSGLGMMRDQRSARRPLESLGANRLREAGRLGPLIITKTNARSSVHRPGYMDYIGVLEFDADGQPVVEHRFIGLFTSGAYNRRPWDIPIVRQRFEHVMERSRLSRTGHSGKALKHILETLPRDELFQADEHELYRLAEGILGLQERARSKLFLRRSAFGQFWSALVYIPRDRYNTDVRLRIEQLLKDTLHADQIDSVVQFGESRLAQLYFVVRPRAGEEVEVDEAALESNLASLMRNWQDDLREQLVMTQGEEEGLALAERFGGALPAGYIEQVSPLRAAEDVQQLALLDPARPLAVKIQQLRADQRDMRFKLYRLHDEIALSDILPVLENMGLRVIAQHPHRVDVQSEGGMIEPVHVHDFEVEATHAGAAIPDLAPAFEEAFLHVWCGQAENDGLGKLVLAAGLHWKQLAMLRAYIRYLQQVNVPFSQAYIEQTLVRYPLLTRLLVELFEGRFDPACATVGRVRIDALHTAIGALALSESEADDVSALFAGRRADRDQHTKAARAAIVRLLERVASLDDDRIVRSFVELIDATLRCNYYVAYPDGQRRDGGPADYLSFKLDPSRIGELPKPRPYREIWVCGPRVEGIHLRFGPVARGGLRWSDRREDFRTEVLGLVKAQMVKNTVIVPVGSKGGFVAKQLPDPAQDRDAWFNEGVACYKRFINAMLDITDNLVEGQVVPPDNVVRHDGDDPYLVVAADKGTASFSDTANAIAQAHGFWLDDAFASGGSVGYDHKGMGITARGAWESVKRHFRALGHDCQNEDFTAVGIGDMSGDVFGNGMLLSRHVRLVAAFDHRHIFLDPDPDAATSFAERERLFKLPRSSWADYDAALISAGGGVHARNLKAIPVTAQVRAVLGLDDGVDSLTPTELMSAILRAPVDLLWNGGIGTYVKGSRESHADVGDRANNALRVDGAQLRCKVVGEGGNLGMTQSGRIEAALNGVLLNTDFIDNSAGVDTSDHEVNIKILLNGEVRKGALKLAQRNKLLASMTDEVAQLVLHDNYRQNQTLSLMQRMSLTRLGSKVHFIRTLESQGLLDRQIEFLPSDAELEDRKARGIGLTRPELAVLLSYAKLVVYPQLLASDVPEYPYLSRELERYFPAPLQKRYAAQMQQHQLRREIIATAVTNSTINRMGATFLMRMQEDSGRDMADIAKAYTITRETLDARDLWQQIDALDGHVAEATQIDALQTIWTLQRSFTRWLLSRPGNVPAISAAVDRYKAGFEQIRLGSSILSAAQRPDYEARHARWLDKGVPDALALQLAALPYLESAPDLIELAQETRQPVVEVAKAYFRLSHALRGAWLSDQIAALVVDGRWHAVARGVLTEELAAQLRELTRQVLKMPAKTVDGKVDAWLQRDDQSLRFTLAMLDELSTHKSLDYPTVSVAVQRLSQMASRG